MRKQYTTDAYLTLLVSLVITTLISLILALFRGAGIGEAKMKSETVTEVAMESALSEYNQALFERYDLLMVDLSYGGGEGGIHLLKERLNHYAQKNLEKSLIGSLKDGDFVRLRVTEVLIPEYLLACDGDGRVFRRQILAYMRAEPAEDFLAETADNISVLKSNGYDTRDVAAEREANYEELQNIYEDKDEEDKEQIPSEIEEAHLISMRGALSLTHPNLSAVSRARIQLSDYISHRRAEQGIGFVPAENLSAVEVGLIDRYIFEKCGSWSKQVEGSLLKYQIEYMVAGKNSDYDNLDSIATTLLFWREASNYMYILTDGGKVAWADALGLTVALLTLTPEAQVIIKNAVLFAWSLAESIADVKALFNGGKVPIVKSADTWQTGIFGFGGGAGKGCSTGLDYDGYLAMLLYMTNMKTVCLRLMDVMEMDLRQMPGQEHFRMDLCLDQMKAQFSYDSSIGFKGTFTRERGYETKYPEGSF